MVHIEKDVSDVLGHGTTNLTTANTPSKVSSSPLVPKKGMQLRAGIANVGIIYIGDSGAGNNIALPACGLPMEAGDQLFVPCEDPGTVYANNASANDIIHWLIV